MGFILEQAGQDRLNCVLEDPINPKLIVYHTNIVAKRIGLTGQDILTNTLLIGTINSVPLGLGVSSGTLLV